MIGPYTAPNAYYLSAVLPEVFFVRVGTLRALYQASTIDAAFGHFSGTHSACVLQRERSIGGERRDWPSPSTIFFKPVDEAQVHKCDGLSANPNLASYIG